MQIDHRCRSVRARHSSSFARALHRRLSKSDAHSHLSLSHHQSHQLLLVLSRPQKAQISLCAFCLFCVFCGLLLRSQPFIDALADELAHIFKLTRRLLPKLLELIRIEREAIRAPAPEPSRWSKLVFIIGCELS